MWFEEYNVTLSGKINECNYRLVDSQQLVDRQESFLFSHETIHIGVLGFLLLQTDYRLLANLKCVVKFWQLRDSVTATYPHLASTPSLGLAAGLQPSGE